MWLFVAFCLWSNETADAIDVILVEKPNGPPVKLTNIEVSVSIKTPPIRTSISLKQDANGVHSSNDVRLKKARFVRISVMFYMTGKKQKKCQRVVSRIRPAKPKMVHVLVSVKPRK